MRIRASTCRPRGWSRLRSPLKVQCLWTFGGICGGGMPAEAASAPHFQTPAPCFLLHPLHLFLPTIHAQLCGRGPDPSLAHRTGLSYQTQSDGVWQVLEDWGPGHSCSPPSAHSARRRLHTVPRAGRGFPAPPPLSPFSPPYLDRRVDSPALSGRGSRPSGRTSG